MLRRRVIHVDGTRYGYTVRFTNQGHVTVGIWQEEPDRRSQLRVLVRFDDPWIHYGIILTAPPERVAEVFTFKPVSPSLVEGLIRAGIAAGWQPGSRGATAKFSLGGVPGDHISLIPVNV